MSSFVPISIPTKTRRSAISVLAMGFCVLFAGQAQNIRAESNKIVSKTALYRDHFDVGLRQWQIETERPGKILTHDGQLDIDVSAGATLWFRQEISGPVMIEYEVMAVADGGPNDHVSDLNCFWMASDPKRPNEFLSPPRSGRFEDYNTLLMYYVGLGGNRNTTTRFRRYIGSATERPLLPQNDLSAPEALLQPNRWQTIRLIADGKTIQYYRDGIRLFDYADPTPYTHGYFGFRTTLNHMRVRNFHVFRLVTNR